MEGNNIKESIIKLLGKRNGLTISEIADSLDLHRHTASRYIFALKEAGYVECHEAGRAKLCFLTKKKPERGFLSIW